MISIESLQVRGVDARGAPRKPLNGSAVVTLAMQRGKARTTDISESGLGLTAPFMLPQAAEVTVEFSTYINGELHRHHVTGKVVYCIIKGMEGYRIGITFTRVPPEVLSFVNQLPAL